MIPNQLRNDRIKFCRIRKGTKKPFELDWTNKPYSWQEIIKFLESNDEQYGVLCGYGDIAVIDSDNQALQVAIENMFPKTFRVKTGSGGTHNYFFIPDLKQKIILNLDEEPPVHLGEVQSYGSQVVGAGSIHPNGNTYEVLEDHEITTISCELLFSCLKPFMKKEIERSEDNAFVERQQSSEIDELSVLNIWNPIGLKKVDDEYYGAHPIHGSSGGMNFWINPSKNTWHCFRCNSGGGALSAIAVKEGILDCSEARRGNLRGDSAKKCIEIAKSKYGLQQNNRDSVRISNRDANNKEVEEIDLIWEHQLQSYEIANKDWIIEKLIPTKSVCIMTGKRGTMKTFISLNMAYAIASGEDFLNYQTEKGKVIYLDKENGLGVMKQRTAMLKKGMSMNGDYDIGFICFSQLKIDKLGDICLLEKLIEKEKPALLIIDTYRRSVSFDENDAGEVSKLFVDTLRPLVEKYNFSVLLIHHNRKSSNSHRRHDEGTDEMDELRGSSDLANYADIIIKLDRLNKKTLIIKQLKNRNAEEEKPIKLNIEFYENESVNIAYDGEFVRHSNIDRACEIILLWCSTNKIKSFKTKDVKDLCFQKGIKERNFNYALQNLQSRGLIEKVGHGDYNVQIS